MVEPGFRFRCSFNFHKASSEIARCGESVLRRTARNSENFLEDENLRDELDLRGRCFADKESRRHRCGLALHMAKNRAVLVSSAVSEAPTGLHITSASRALSWPAVPTLRGWLPLPDVGDISESEQVMSSDIFLR